MHTKTRMNVPPVSVPRPNKLNSRRFLRRHKLASTTECRCDLHRSRLFASEARNGLPKRTQGLTTSAKPFLLLSWTLLARPSKGKRRPLSSHMFCKQEFACVEVKKLGFEESAGNGAGWIGR
jgi:hypothetical protein